METDIHGISARKMDIYKNSIIDREFPFCIVPRKDSAVVYGNYHVHPPFLELQFIHSGSGYYYIKERMYPISRNAIFVMHSNDVHTYIQNKPDVITSKASLLFSRRIFLPGQLNVLKKIPGLLTCGTEAIHLVNLDSRDAAEVEMFLRVLSREWQEKEAGYQEIIRSMLVSLLLFVARASRKDSANIERSEGDSLTVRRVLEIIDREYTAPLSLGKISGMVGRSSYYISHLVREKTGITFSEHLTARRIMEAKRILESGDNRKIFALAHDVGFSSLNTFKRRFNQMTGLSPGRYRSFYRGNDK